MKRFLNAFGMTTIIFSLFLPLISSAQDVNYGTRMERFTVGADYRDGFPHSTTTQEFLTGYAMPSAGRPGVKLIFWSNIV